MLEKSAEAIADNHWTVCLSALMLALAPCCRIIGISMPCKWPRPCLGCEQLSGAYLSHQKMRSSRVAHCDTRICGVSRWNWLSVKTTCFRFSLCCIGDLIAFAIRSTFPCTSSHHLFWSPKSLIWLLLELPSKQSFKHSQDSEKSYLWPSRVLLVAMRQKHVALWPLDDSFTEVLHAESAQHRLATTEEFERSTLELC